MRELALFAGVGGGILGGRLLGWKTICAVEIEKYCREILLQRQADGSLEKFPIWDDVKTFDGKPWRGKVDIVTGGFPCQDISIAKRDAKGLIGDRSRLWYQMLRIIGEVRPRQIFVENVPAIVNRGLSEVIGGLSKAGYSSAWKTLSGKNCGAVHTRDRLWLLANSDSERLKARCRKGVDLDRENMGFFNSPPSIGGKERHSFTGRDFLRTWGDESNETGCEDCGGHNDVSSRLDAVKALGNAQIPRVAARAYRILDKILEDAEEITKRRTITK